MAIKKESKLTFIDLFAGCGGLSEGFLQSGKYEALAHVEWEMPMITTLRNRLVEKWNHLEEDALKRVIHFDIQKTEELISGNWSDETKLQYSKTNHSSIIDKGLNGLVGKKKVNLVIGGPPCQAYSIAGRAQDKNSMKDDYRNYLFESFIKVVDEFKPEVFVFENVPGLLSAKPGGKPVTERIYEAFNEVGYEIRKPELLKKSVYTASELGVPQKRNRVIIIGVKKSTKISLEELYNELDRLKKKR
jgi:DNA (cytosine-5)-methyltransferase 1